MEKTDMVYGTRAVMEAARSGRQMEKVLIQAGTNNELIRDLVQLLKEQRIPFSWVPAAKLSRIGYRNHQGVVGYLSAVQYASLQRIIDHAYSEGRAPFLLLLDRVTDVRNFGAVARTCECAGMDGIIIEEKGNAPVTSDAVKTSAGALHHLPVSRVKSMKQTIKELQDNGIQVVACTEKAADEIYAVDFSGPSAILMGSEEDGVAEPLLKAADRLARIPMRGKIASLNVSVAAGVAIYEAVRQKQLVQKGKKS